MVKGYHSRFVADGLGRARAALEPAVREQVEGEFATEWNASSLVHRWFLQRRMEREIARRLEMQAPRDALY